MGGVGRGNRKSLKTLRVESLGLNLVGRIITIPRYVIDITRPNLLYFTDLLSFICSRYRPAHIDLITAVSPIRLSGRGLEGGEKFENYSYVYLTNVSPDLNETCIQSNIMSQMLNFQFGLDPGTLRGEEEKRKSWKTLRVERFG